MEIIFEDRQDFVKLDQDIMDKIEAVILEVLAYEGYDDDYEVSLSFVSNDEIREINRDYRNIDKVTDVLSFPMYDGEEVDVDFGAISLGDRSVSWYVIVCSTYLAMTIWKRKRPRRCMPRKRMYSAS